MSELVAASSRRLLLFPHWGGQPFFVWRGRGRLCGAGGRLGWRKCRHPLFCYPSLGNEGFSI